MEIALAFYRYPTTPSLEYARWLSLGHDKVVIFFFKLPIETLAEETGASIEDIYMHLISEELVEAVIHKLTGKSICVHKLAYYRNNCCPKILSNSYVVYLKSLNKLREEIFIKEAKY